MAATSKTYSGRYAVVERVGTGGMAEVFRARDELLGREVALKVLSRRLSSDRSFVERFRREAQAAANLNHPNIVSLYDYGSDDGTYFIVMEFIEGRSLAEVITDGPVMPERAAEIGAEVAGALQRAHSSGLVHRDIKPANIMLTASGEAKVTDFGIARALTRDGEQTVTQTGMVLGTAAYLSPEQAQGDPLDARSDIYSLGCVLYEMVTGRPPFTGETPLAVAYKHVRETPPAPSRVTPDVPAALDAIVMKAMAKNPDNRYASGTEMRQDLERFVRGQGVHATPLLAEDTAVAAAVGGTQVLERPPDATAAAPVVARGRGRGPWFWIGMAVAILALFGLLAFLLLDNLLGSAAEVRVPDVVGLTESRARDLLEDRGLDPEVERERSARPVGQVINQDPPAGASVEEGAAVTLTVSRGPARAEVPDLVGLTRRDAQRALEDVGLELGNVARESSDEEPGIVLSQSAEPGESLDKGSAVDVVLSSGPEAVIVPFVVGQTEEEAIAEIEAQGLVADVARAPDEAEEGTVVAQDPEGGTEAAPGDVIAITVSEGPEETPLPDVTGADGDEAEQQLESDFGVEVTLTDETEPGCSGPPGTVCRQDPAPGTPVAEGDQVTLFVKPEI